MKHRIKPSNNRIGALVPLVLVVIAVLATMMIATLGIASASIQLHRQGSAQTQAIIDQHSGVLWAQAAGAIDTNKRLVIERSDSRVAVAEVDLQPIGKDRLRVLTHLKAAMGNPEVRLTVTIDQPKPENGTEEDTNGTEEDTDGTEEDTDGTEEDTNGTEEDTDGTEEDTDADANNSPLESR